MRILIIFLVLSCAFSQPIATQTPARTPVCLVLDKIEKIDLKDDVNRDEQSSTLSKFPIRDVFPPNRRITFRLTNFSNTSIVVYGLSYDTTFNPSGSLLGLNQLTNNWEHLGKQIDDSKLNYIKKQDQKILEPNESFTFFILQRIKENEIKKIKRTIYFSFESQKKITDVISPEILLQ